MAWFTRLSGFTRAIVALILGLVVNTPALQAQSSPPSLSSELENAFQRPSFENQQVKCVQSLCTPCSEVDKPLVALVPQSGGKTVAEYPTIVWYMPRISPENASAPAVEFVLRDANKRQVYSVQYALAKSGQGIAGTPGIMSLTVSSLYPLQIGQEYHWQLTLICDSQDSDRSDDLVVEGGLQRVELDPILASRTQQATPEERVVLYAKAQLWYETLATLIQLRRDRPNDKNLADAWKTLLNSVGLNIIAEERID
jgi:hypothetical protein